MTESEWDALVAAAKADWEALSDEGAEHMNGVAGAFSSRQRENYRAMVEKDKLSLREKRTNSH